MIPSIGSCSRLYSCSQKVAFHVHASRLLCRSSSVDFKQEVTSDIALQAAFEEDKRSVVDGMNRQPQEMNVKDDDETEESTRKRKTRGGAKAAPRTCADAIELGLDCFDQADYEQAIELFTLALELPGKGAIRLAGSVKEYACPSEGEEQAALYNIACCYSKLGEIESGLTCLKGLLESGYDDYDTLRTDKDLEALRASKDFDAVIGKHDNLASKLLGRKKRKTDKKKGWLSRW